MLERACNKGSRLTDRSTLAHDGNQFDTKSNTAISERPRQHLKYRIRHSISLSTGNLAQKRYVKWIETTLTIGSHYRNILRRKPPWCIGFHVRSHGTKTFLSIPLACDEKRTVDCSRGPFDRYTNLIRPACLFASSYITPPPPPLSVRALDCAAAV